MALNANKRSGYASEIMPEIVDADERRGNALPPAEMNGKREGRISPAERVYGKANYKVVTAEEAQANMVGRLAGKIPPIRGGLDDHGRPAPAPVKTVKGKAKKIAVIDEVTKARKGKQMKVNDKDNFDPLGGEYEPGSAALAAEEARLAALAPVSVEDEETSPVAAREFAQAMREVPRGQTIADAWLARRQRASLTLTAGTFSMAIIDVKTCQYGVTVFVPMSDDASFIPKPGSEILLTVGDKSWDCYFPGVYFEVQELKVLGLMLILKETT